MTINAIPGIACPWPGQRQVNTHELLTFADATRATCGTINQGLLSATPQDTLPIRAFAANSYGSGSTQARRNRPSYLLAHSTGSAHRKIGNACRLAAQKVRSLRPRQAAQRKPMPAKPNRTDSTRGSGATATGRGQARPPARSSWRRVTRPHHPPKATANATASRTRG